MSAQIFENFGATSEFLASEGWNKPSAMLGPTVLEWPINLTVIWGIIFGACELAHIFVREGKHCSNYAENIRCHSTKFSPPGDHTP
jgi:hypothetical protein